MSGVIKHKRITIDGDSVVLTAPDDRLMEILNAHVVYTSSATAGNRRFTVEVRDADDVLVADLPAGAQQATSQTRHYTCSRGIARENNFVDDSLHMALPFGIVLLPYWDLIIKDGNAVDTPGDSAVVDIMYHETERNNGDAVT